MKKIFKEIKRRFQGYQYSYQHEGGIKIDLGCGGYKLPGCIGIDIEKKKGVDIVHDLSKGIPFKDSSVSFIHMSHFLEHVNWNLDDFFNEIYRVCQRKAAIVIIVPYLHSWGGFSPGHSHYFSEEWFKNSTIVKKLFKIQKIEYSYTPLMKLVVKRLDLREDEARQLFWNVCSELKMTWTPKK